MITVVTHCTLHAHVVVVVWLPVTFYTVIPTLIPLHTGLVTPRILPLIYAHLHTVTVAVATFVILQFCAFAVTFGYGYTAVTQLIEHFTVGYVYDFAGCGSHGWVTLRYFTLDWLRPVDWLRLRAICSVCALLPRVGCVTF